MRNAEHRFFVTAAIAATAIVLAGFVPFYSLRMMHHDKNLNWLVQMHGLVMALWIALLLTQTLLVARHHVELHRRMGMAGGWVAGAVVLVGIPTLVRAAARQSHDVHSARFRWMLIAFDGLALVVFGGLVGAGLALRRKPDTHKRLMLLATLSLLGPAFGRITSLALRLRGDSDVSVLLLCAGIVVVCVAVDAVRTRRVHPAFVWGGAAVIGMDLVTYWAKGMV